MGCSPSQATPDPASETIPNGQNMNHPPNSETDSANGNSSRIQSNGNSTNGEVKIRKYSRELGVTVCFGPMKVIQPQMKSVAMYLDGMITPFPSHFLTLSSKKDEKNCSVTVDSISFLHSKGSISCG
ncbi:hypothetical protein TrispH2_002200 [Trichoplax sp. H2]|nr:hypothetical protein TrispH2_002200 [Trichoplax sp. H2]|eukprot:RDD45807.1 hypothetical protein TrispH2_002200 [Trichoplax sp. H2]